jgi:membrane associated rhomboid family serine protease
MPIICLTFLAFLAGVYYYQPQPVSLRQTARPSARERLFPVKISLGLGLTLIIIAGLTLDLSTLQLPEEIAFVFGLNRFGFFEKKLFFQVITNNFIHLDILHLVGNLMLLTLFANYERKAGWRRFLMVYLIAAIGSSLLEVLVMPENEFSLGASAGLFGIVAANFLDQPEVAFKQWISALVLVVIFILLLSIPNGPANRLQTDWLAHFLGAMIAAGYVRMNKPVTKDGSCSQGFS